MAETPDNSALVYQTANQYPHLLKENTESSIFEFMQILAGRLVTADSGWGYLTKTPGEKHLTLPNGTFISVDSFCYSPTMQVVDCLTNAVEPKITPTDPGAGPAWQFKPRRENNLWYPIQPSEGGGGGGETPGEDWSDEIADLQRQVRELTVRVGRLESEAISFGTHVGLRAWGNPEEQQQGKVLCAEGGGPPRDQIQFVLTSRSGIGPWETWTIERGY